MTDVGRSQASSASEMTAARCSIMEDKPFDVAMCWGSTGEAGLK